MATWRTGFALLLLVTTMPNSMNLNVSKFYEFKCVKNKLQGSNRHKNKFQGSNRHNIRTSILTTNNISYASYRFGIGPNLKLLHAECILVPR